jgi:hypothetical protein
MIDSPVFVSFFTPNGKYPELAEKLKASLDKFELNCDVMELPQFPSWQTAVAYKPQFILEMFQLHARPVVWMDIDTEVWQFPEMLFGPHDFAVYNWAVDTDHHLDGRVERDKMLCSSGVVKFGWTEGAYNLLKRWQERMVGRESADDPELDWAYNEGADVNPLWLPKTYNRMDKHTHHWSSIPASEVVINHDYTGGRHG